MEDDIYSNYFRHHYELHGTINNIGDNDTVEYEGHTLKIGWFKRSGRNKHKYYTQGLKNKKLKIKIFNRFGRLRSNFLLHR